MKCSCSCTSHSLRCEPTITSHTSNIRIAPQGGATPIFFCASDFDGRVRLRALVRVFVSQSFSNDLLLIGHHFNQLVNHHRLGWPWGRGYLWMNGMWSHQAEHGMNDSNIIISTFKRLDWKTSNDVSLSLSNQSLGEKRQSNERSECLLSVAKQWLCNRHPHNIVGRANEMSRAPAIYCCLQLAIDVIARF